MKRKFVFLFFLLLLTACTSKSNEQEPIKIGAVLSLTGFASYYGESSKNGIELAIEELNAAGGINRRLLQVVYEDDATDGKNAVTATSKLINVDKVHALVGGTWDLSLEPMVPVAEASKLLIVNPSTGNTKADSRLSPYLFRTWPAIHRHVATFKPIIEKEKIKTVVIFRNSGSWAFAHKSALEKILLESGGKLIADFAGPNVDNNDFATEVTKAKSLTPDAIFFATGTSDAALVVKKMKEQGFSAKLLSSEGALGDAIKKNLVSIQDAEGAHIIDLLPKDSDFRKRHLEKFGKEPGISADTAYDAVKVLAEAIEITESTDSEQLRQYLESSTYFDENGDSLRAVPIYQIKNGEKQYLMSPE